MNLVQLLRGRVVGIDIGEHLTEAGARAGIDQGWQEKPADARMQMLGMHIDRVLHGVAIGWPLAERHGIGIAHNSAAALGHEMRQPAAQHVLAAALDVVGVHGFGVELAQATRMWWV